MNIYWPQVNIMWSVTTNMGQNNDINKNNNNNNNINNNKTSTAKLSALWASDFLTFIKLYSNKLSVYKTGTIHNLMHNSIRFQSPDQEFFLAFRLVASSFIGARIALQDQCQVVLCLPDGWGVGPHTEVHIPCPCLIKDNYNLASSPIFLFFNLFFFVSSYIFISLPIKILFSSFPSLSHIPI